MYIVLQMANSGLGRKRGILCLLVYRCTQQERSLEVVGRWVDISPHVGVAVGVGGGGGGGYNVMQVVQVAMNQ
jgi:hypothetical protein